MIDELKAWVAEGRPRKHSPAKLDRSATVEIDSNKTRVWCYDYTLEDGVMFCNEIPPAGLIQDMLVEAKTVKDRKKLQELQASLGVQDGSI